MYSTLLFHRFKGTIFICESKEKVPPKTQRIERFIKSDTSADAVTKAEEAFRDGVIYLCEKLMLHLQKMGKKS